MLPLNKQLLTLKIENVFYFSWNFRRPWNAIKSTFSKKWGNVFNYFNSLIIHQYVSILLNIIQLIFKRWKKIILSLSAGIYMAAVANSERTLVSYWKTKALFDVKKLACFCRCMDDDFEQCSGPRIEIQSEACSTRLCWTDIPYLQCCSWFCACC